ncbi:sensor histidine kinase [Variovorax sp. M-6]|uniref:sensor histidine kinase n=1 Tax=Variovorax sp. M-6 TaxID=3233041 RepID=UPI003F99EDA3
MRQVNENHGSLLLDISATSQATAARQFGIQQLTFWMTVVGILVSEFERPTLEPSDFTFWLGVTALSWLARIFLFTIVHRAEPAKVVGSTALRLLPLLIVSIACVYWIWTVSLFAGTAISITTVFLTVGFLNTTIAMTTTCYATPIAAVVYNLSLWGSLSAALYAKDQATVGELLVLNATVFVILWIFVVHSSREQRNQSIRTRDLVELSESLRRSNTELEQMKASITHDLEARSSFFAEATHDFKQRLHGAKMVVLTARSQLRQDHNPQEALDRLGEEVDGLKTYISSILNFARLESSPVKPRLKAVGLQSVFQDLDLRFEAEALETGKRLHFRPTHIKVATDVFMLERMLGNLVSNAMRFTRRGVLVAARRRGGGVSIEVWDQGPGIEDSASERVFQAFQQLPDSLATSEHRGVGLGLAVVSRLSQQLCYRVSIGSRLGSGSVLRIWIPGDFIISQEEQTRPLGTP